jgi:hypothetical protein
MLQITLVMEDKISLDDLQEEIAEFEDYVQSTDVAGMSTFLILPVLKLTPSYAKALEERSRFILYGIRRRMHFCYNATTGVNSSVPNSSTAYPPFIFLPFMGLGGGWQATSMLMMSTGALCPRRRGHH